jgi:hypothetical protein
MTTNNAYPAWEDDLVDRISQLIHDFLERLARTYPHLSENRGQDDLLRLHSPKLGKKKKAAAKAAG